MFSRAFLRVLFHILPVSVFAALAFPQLAPAAPPKMVEVLVRFRNSPGANEEGLVRKHGGRVKQSFQIVPAVAATLPAAALENMKNEPGVEAVEIDGKFEAHDLANTWGVARIGCGPVHAGSYAASAIPVLGTGIKVAVVDTGVDFSHPELILNYAGGYDFINNDSDPRDDNGHGTHVAGTIAAVRDGSGVVGAAPEADIYGVKVLGADGSGSFSAVLAGLDWCVNNGMAVANFSLGSSSDPGSTVKQAFDNAYAAGLLIVASAGNAGEGADTVGYPAKYASVIAVASTTSTDQRSSFSSTGPAVELAAPGSSIYSTLIGGGYGYKNGTSMAAPHVAGVAALVIAAGIRDSSGNGKLNDETRALLRSTSQDLGAAGFDNYFGQGLVDAKAAVVAVANSAPAPVFDPPSNLSGTVSGNTVTLNWTDNANCEQGFEIQYGVKTKTKTNWYAWGYVGANITQYASSLNTEVYFFRVRAHKDNSTAFTAWSNQIQLNVGTKPGRK